MDDSGSLNRNVSKKMSDSLSYLIGKQEDRSVGLSMTPSNRPMPFGFGPKQGRNFEKFDEGESKSIE